MPIRRRTLVGAVGGGLVGLAGCLEGATTNAEGCLSSPPDDARSPAEIRELLPEYESEIADRDEQWDRADEIQEALWEGMDGHPWRCSIGQTLEDGEKVLVVRATCVPRARRYVPGEWGGVTIELEHTACELELL